MARRSRGTPRLANRLLKRVRDFAQVKYDGVITEEVADYALNLLDVDKYGLDHSDRNILLTIIEKFHELISGNARHIFNFSTACRCIWMLTVKQLSCTVNRGWTCWSGHTCSICWRRLGNDRRCIRTIFIKEWFYTKNS